MKLLRKTFFWLHLVVGLGVGLGVAVMAGTGLVMAFEKPIVQAAETYDGRSPGPKLKAESIENLLNAAQLEVKDAAPTAVTAYADLDKPAAVQFGREKIVYFNNYTLKPVGTGAAGLRGFFHFNEELHRWLATTAGTPWRTWGRWATGIVNLGFLVLIVSGLWVWFPRKLRWQNFRPAFVPKLTARGKARDFNWHNTAGFWLLIPLTLIVLTGTVMSYPWANALLFRAVGDTPPAPRAQGGPGGERGRTGTNGQGGQGGERGGQRRGEGGRGEGQRGGRGPVEPINVDGFNDLWANTEDASPGWQSITLRLGGGRRGGGEGGGGGGGGNGGPGGGEGGDGERAAGVALAVNYANPLSPLQRVTFNYDRRTGELISKQTFDDIPAGRRARSLVLPIHRGEILGLPGMAVAAISCLAALVLVYTGFALSWRRLVRPVLAKVRNRRAAAIVSTSEERQVVPSPGMAGRGLG